MSDPYTGTRVGTVAKASVYDVRAAFDYAAAYPATLTRYERSRMLERAAGLLRDRAEEASDLISLESGLSKQDSRYEIGRVADAFGFASIEALRDDGQSFSYDLTPQAGSGACLRSASRWRGRSSRLRRLTIR